MRLISFWHWKGLTFLDNCSELQKRVLAGGFWAGLVKGLSLPLNLVVVGLLARLLPPSEMGVYFLALNLVTVVATLGMLGMGQTMVRLVASSIAIGDYARAYRTVQHAFAWGFLGAIITAIVMYIFGTQFGLPIYAILWLAIWGFVQTGQNLLAEAMRGFNDIRMASIFQNRSIPIFVFASILLIFWLQEIGVELQIIFSILAFTSSFAFLLGLLYLWKKIKPKAIVVPEPTKNAQLELFRQALPVFGMSVLGIIRTQIGIWIVAAFLSNEEVALYGSANRLVYLISVPLVTIINATIPPIIAELFIKQEVARLEHMLRRLANVSSIFAVILVVFLVGGGNLILELVYGEFYKGAWLILGILAISQLIDVVSGSCGLTLIMTEHQNVLLKITLVSATLAVIITIVGVNFWGMLGVAIAATISLIIQNILMLLSVKRKLGIWTHVKFRF